MSSEQTDSEVVSAEGETPVAAGSQEQTVPPKVEEIVTPNILNAILKEYNSSQERNVELVDWEAKLGTVAGDNYMSIIYALKMTLKNAKGDSVSLPVMLKVLPRNEIRVKIINDGNVFLREVYMYEKIIPAMEEFLRERLPPAEAEVCARWPKCFASKTDGKGDYLAMEDLKAKGFKMASRQSGLDFEHCKLVMKAMARYHAVSYAMFLGEQDKILERYPWLDETMFKEDKIPEVWKDMIQHTYQTQAANLLEAGEEMGAHLLGSVYSNDYFNQLYELLGAKRRWAVIGHGDCWTNNILFRYDPETNKPVELKFVDYQICRASSRAVDIHYFLYSSPQMNVLNEKENELTQIYFDEFTRSVKRLGVDVDGQELTKENFEQEIDSIRYYGVVTGFMLALVTSAESADVPEMENITEEQMNDPNGTGKNFLLNMMKEKAMEKVKNLARVHLPKCQQMQKYLPK